MDSISPGSNSTAIYPWGTPEQVNRATESLGNLDFTGTFDLAWTSYRHSAGQASRGELAGSYAMFGTNLIPGSKSGKAVTAYLSRNADDLVQYAGITNNMARRAGEQLRKNGINIEPLIENLTRPDGRAVEEALIVIHGLKKNGGTLINKIHSISPKNPEYAEKLQRGYELLQTVGYK